MRVRKQANTSSKTARQSAAWPHRKVKVGVNRPIEGADGARKGNKVRGKEDVVWVGLVEGARAGLVCRRSHKAVWDARGDPHSPLGVAACTKKPPQMPHMMRVKNELWPHILSIIG